jgi:hypothetical protein
VKLAFVVREYVKVKTKIAVGGTGRPYRAFISGETLVIETGRPYRAI